MLGNRIAVGVWLCAVMAARVGAQTEAGFVSLFNGRDLDGWVAAGRASEWQVVGGALRSAGGEWLRTTRRHGDFVLRLEWMLSANGGSGVYLRSGESSPWRDGVEVAIRGPVGAPRNDFHATGALDGYVAAKPRGDNSPERWHQLEITCDYKRITVVCDGVTCCQADMAKTPSLRYKALEGYIGLQGAHGSKGKWAQFRNVRIKDLDADPSYVLAAMQSEDAQQRRRAGHAALAMGAPMMGKLFGLLRPGESDAARVARVALFALAARAADPNAPQRQAVTAALCAQLRRKCPTKTQRYAAELLRIVGGQDNAVEPLVNALADPDRHEPALAALQRIPSPKATQALLDMLGNVSDHDKPMLIEAIGHRRDAATVGPLAAILAVPNQPCQVAACRALGIIADAAAIDYLKDAATLKTPARVRRAAIDAILAAAERKRKSDLAGATALFQFALENAVTGEQTCDALVGLHRVNDPNLVAKLIAALEHPATRNAALELLCQYRDKATVNRVEDELRTATGYKRGMLIRYLQRIRSQPNKATP